MFLDPSIVVEDANLHQEENQHQSYQSPDTSPLASHIRCLWVGSPGGNLPRAGRRLVDDVAVASAAGLGRDGRRAGDLLEVDVRVVGALEPVEAPVAPGLERLGEVVAVGARTDAAVAVAPAVGRSSVLAGAGCGFPGLVFEVRLGGMQGAS